MARLRLTLLGALVTVVVVVTATTAPAAPPTCTHGVSAVGPVVVINGRLNRQRSDQQPHTAACLPQTPTAPPPFSDVNSPDG
jgi:hypothetical protein